MQTAPAAQLELVSLDLQPGWGPYVSCLGAHGPPSGLGGLASSYTFGQSDLYDLGGGGLGRTLRELGVEGSSAAAPRGGGDPRVDYAIISNVLIYCSDERTVRAPPVHAAACPATCCSQCTHAQADMLADLLTARGVRAVLVSERGTDQRMVDMLRARGLSVIRLMSQDVGRDDRQLVFLPPAPGSALAGEGASWGVEVAFPNVPYEERKEELRRQAAAS